MKTPSDRLGESSASKGKTPEPASSNSNSNSGFFSALQTALNWDSTWLKAEWFKEWERTARRET
jgi:hypothetical protein